MIPKIKILSDSLINKIAAGEVIERPASIVKELIDNSIDAKSDGIIVYLKDGGKGFISVSDNGEGMSPEDAVIAFERHATSKLSSEEDLDRISTLGFRGEALPSIAAVSEVSLTTKMTEGPGVELSVLNGKIVHQKEVARGKGTEITIFRLFDNFPARKKFLKSGSTELANITSVINQLSLAHFQISFELVHQGRRIFRYPAVETLRERVYQIYGQEILDHLVFVERKSDPYFSIFGFISLPPHSHGNRTYQELFINKRPIKNPMISHAVYEAYATHLMKGQNPFFIFLMDIDPSKVDVNVHPSKKEVRFSDASSIHQKVFTTVRETLNGNSLQCRVLESRDGNEPVRSYPPPERYQVQIKEAAQEYVNRTVFGKEPEYDRKDENRDLFKNAETGQQPIFKVLGQFNSMFLLVQSEGELLIIDQHAAHERILFEKFLDQYVKTTPQVQSLLIPQQIDVSFKDLLVLQEYESVFHKMGFEFDYFGERTILIRSVPSFLSGTNILFLISDLIEDIQLFQEVFSEKERAEKIIATMACHGAVKAGQTLGQTEISTLYNDLMQLNGPLTCPHGRPIRKSFSVKELEKLFHRI
ncbi:MAG: DNA mismatch repair endonuclease MutL [Nitrospirae bacterium]|nr:DNA mismatch repair endonuclease MutL [Nitrospirota bacterium]